MFDSFVIVTFISDALDSNVQICRALNRGDLQGRVVASLVSYARSRAFLHELITTSLRVRYGCD